MTEAKRTETSDEDHLYNYHSAKLVFGLLLMEFNDAIKEGDGERLLDVYKVALLTYKNMERPSMPMKSCCFLSRFMEYCQSTMHTI